MNVRLAPAAFLALAAAAAALAGCTPGTPGPVATGTNAPSASPTGTSVYDLAAGDCFDAPGQAGGADPTSSPGPTSSREPTSDSRATDAPDQADATPGLGAAVEYVDPADCAGPHDYEAYASLLEPAGDYPGDPAIRQDAATRCADSFADFVGVRYEDSALAIGYLAPTRADWAAGNRDVLCFLSDPAGPLTGSARQTAR